MRTSGNQSSERINFANRNHLLALSPFVGCLELANFAPLVSSGSHSRIQSGSNETDSDPINDEGDEFCKQPAIASRCVTKRVKDERKGSAVKDGYHDEVEYARPSEPEA